ncbi:MAG: hypothetical protein H0W40_11955 [Methylibium sp.]|uniref:DUF1302 family protein n=1 Tax=Methylibium sp. TaxID=2067992 RepID=UPI0017EA58B6|nr:DUF1302 family protein [Methylibium sp.]MBA3598071.1 hypothetical protein [Methylibium sp.]
MKCLLLLTLPLLMLPVHAADEPAPTRTPSTAPADATSDDEPPAASRAKRRVATRSFRPVLKYGVDDVLVEAGALPDAPEADNSTTLRASPYVLWQPSRAWEFRAGLRLDAVSQAGGTASYEEGRADYGDTYLRYRSGDTRLTLGAQTIVWGRVDAVPVIDRVSRVDLSRFVLDDLSERRRAQLAARWEQNFGDHKLDVVLLPVFRGARLPDTESVWSPIDQRRGRVIGVAPSPALEALVSSARIREDDSGSGGAALRFTKAGGAIDYGLTLARTRQTLPYYRVDLAEQSLTAIYPYNTFAGGDVEFVTGDYTWRAEIGHTDGVPVTRPDAQMSTTRSLDAVVGVEFFPGGKDTRVNFQVAARSLTTDRTILELKEYYGVNGEVESTFAQGRWQLGMRFFSGLNVHDLYLSPKLSYLGWEPHEIYLVGRYFNGEARSLGGFHEDHSMIAIGLSTRF